MCMFESSQKDESGAKQEDCPQGGHEAAACFTTVRKQSLLRIPPTVCFSHNNVR